MKAGNYDGEHRVESSADELRAEIRRLREDNADLRASALRWEELYEAALAKTTDQRPGSRTRRRAGHSADVSVRRRHHAHIVP